MSKTTKESKEYSFTFGVPVEKIKQVRKSLYKNIIEDFCNSGQRTAMLSWKGSQKFATVVIGLRNAIKSGEYNAKLVTKNKKIYLVVTEEKEEEAKPSVVTTIPTLLEEKEREQP